MIGALLLAVWGIVMAAISSSGVVLLDGMFDLVSASIRASKRCQWTS